MPYKFESEVMSAFGELLKGKANYVIIKYIGRQLNFVRTLFFCAVDPMIILIKYFC